MANPVAALHLQRVGGLDIARAIAHMALDRRLLASTPGLRFWKLLGTGTGRTFQLRDADVHTWGLFTVWDSPHALELFERSHPVSLSWTRRSSEQWSAHLRPLRWHGSWSGHEPFGQAEDASAVTAGVVASLTRARIRAGKLRSFSRAIPQTAQAVHRAPGLLCAIGIGEAPIGLQATFSLWQSEQHLEEFAYGGRAHLDVVRQTRIDRWYAEELFSRFEVLGTFGTIDGFFR